MAKITSRSSAKAESKKRVTRRQIQIAQPRKPIPSFEISSNALETMDHVMKNYQSGNVSLPIITKRFEAVGRWCFQVRECFRRIDHHEFSQGNFCNNFGKGLGEFLVEVFLRIHIPKTFDRDIIMHVIRVYAIRL